MKTDKCDVRDDSIMWKTQKKSYKK